MGSSNSRLKKATYNVIFLGLYQVTVFLCNLILPRFILVAYGSEYNGIVSSITQFLNFISILRLGVAGATRVELYKSLGHKDKEKTSSIIRATENFMRKIAIVFIVYLIILAVIYPNLIESKYGFGEVGSLVFIIGLGTLAQYFFGITYSTLLQADQRLYIYNIIQIAATISNTLLAVIFIKAGFSIHIVKLGSSLIFTISPIILNIYVTKRYSLNKYAIPDNIALKKRGDVVAHSVANIVHENTDIVVLTLLTNVKIVSVYTVYNLVMNGLKQLMTIFTSGLESAFGDMWVKNEENKIYKNLELYEFLIYSFAAIVFPCAANLIIPFVQIYTHGITDINYVVPAYAFLAVLAQTFYCIRMPYLTLVQAAGCYKETKNGAFAEATLNIVLSLVLTIKFGLIGVVIGTLTANIFRTIQYAIFLSTQLLSRPFSVVSKRLIWLSFTFAISVILYRVLYCLLEIQILSWFNWLIAGIISFLLTCSVTLISAHFFYRNNLIDSIKIVKRMGRR